MKKEIRCSICSANWDVMLVHNDEVICFGCFIKANKKLAGYLVHFLTVLKKIRLIDPYPRGVKFPKGASEEKKLELLVQSLKSGKKTKQIYPSEPFGNGIGVPSQKGVVDTSGQTIWSQKQKVIKRRALVTVGRVVNVGKKERYKTTSKKKPLHLQKKKKQSLL